MWSFKGEQHVLLRKYFQVQCRPCFLIHEENDRKLEEVSDVLSCGISKVHAATLSFFISLGALLCLSIRKGHFLFLLHPEKTDFSLSLVCPRRHWCRYKFPNGRSEAGSGL